MNSPKTQIPHDIKIKRPSNNNKNVHNESSGGSKNKNKNEEGHTGVTCMTDKIDKNEDAIALLDKGKNFKIAPTNINKVKHDFKVGVERLVCGMKYANPAWAKKEKDKNDQGNTDPNHEQNETDETQDTQQNPHPQRKQHSMSTVTAKFDKDLNPPPRPTREIQHKI